MKKIYSIFTLTMVAVLVFSFGWLSMERTRTLGGDLVCQEVATPPIVDGIIDEVWAEATALTVPLGETANPPDDPSKIDNCAGCHAYDSDVSVTLKAVHTTDRIFMLATWPDPTASFTRGGSWSFETGAWEKPNGIQSEDRISFFWPMGEITGDPYTTGGCMTKCHMYYPTDTDPHVSTHGIVDDAWLESGRADMWHSKAARTDAVISAVGTDLVIDAATSQITAGSYSTLGYADDKYVDIWLDDTQNGEDGGRYGDKAQSGKSSYSHNRIGDKSRPKFMETAPVDFADAMFLTQAEIDDGEVVGDATTGVSDADAATYWPQYLALNAIVPERILRVPEGSRGDLDLGTNWTDGTWTVEFSRELLNGNDDDVQFDILSEYLFNVAQLDNSRHGYEHRTSANYIMSFNAAIEEPTFVGSDACKGCHSDKYNDWVESGHPYKFTIIENGEAPTYPPEAINFQSQYMDSLGDGSHTWNDIAGVIGGYGWKARFIGTDGYVVGTAGSAFSTELGHNQMNFFGGEDHGWVDYDVSKTTKLYNYGCFKCHTTGGETEGTWLEGVDGLGTFTEGGIGCEGCHGPGSEHIGGPSSDNIDRVYEFAHQDNALGGLETYGVVQAPNPDGDDVNFLCGTCHNRGYTNKIDASSGFVKHHEQWDEMMSGPHADAGLTCLTCHNPHVRVIWDGDGITKTCGQCHSEQVATTNHSGGATCLDCHMPYSSKSGTTRGASGYKGDVRSHLLRITPDTESMFVEDGSAIRDDDTRGASLSPAYSCLGCHNDDPADGIPEKTLEAAAAGSIGMHSATGVADFNELNLGIYPNPTSGETRISVNLPASGKVSLSIYNAAGQVVYSKAGVSYPHGLQVIHWDGKSNTGEEIESGYYFIKVSAGSLTSVEKIVLMR